MRELASNFTGDDNKTPNIFSTDNETETNINQDNEMVNTDKDNTNSLNEEYKEILDKMSKTTKNHTNNLSDEGKKSLGNQMINKNLKADVNNQTSLKGNSKEIQTKLQVKKVHENDSNNLIHNGIKSVQKCVYF